LTNIFSSKGILVFASMMLMSRTGFVQAQKTVIQPPDGIVVVRNEQDPALQNGRTLTTALIEDLCLGDISTDTDSSFAAIAFVLVDPEGNIIVLDNKDLCIKIFNAEGKFIRRFGRKGQGPGEIQSPMGMMLSKKNDIVIMDNGNNRLSFFNKDGTCIKSIKLSKGNIYTPVMDSRGYFFGSEFAFSEKVALNLIKLNPEFIHEAVIASINMPGENELPPAELMERFYFQIGKDDDLIWGLNFKYELNFTDHDGKLLRRATRKSIPGSVTRNLFINKLKQENPNRAIPDSISIPKHYPKHLPYFDSIVCDEEGRVFIKTLEGYGSGSIQYDIFNSEGIYISRFKHPENEEIMAIRRGNAYARIRSSEKGNPVVKRYRIIWK